LKSKINQIAQKAKVSDPLLLYPGDKTFKAKLSNLNKNNCVEYASEYFTIAFKSDKIMHFEKNSFAKKCYLLLTNETYG
jgi:hypothetical protein